MWHWKSRRLALSERALGPWPYCSCQKNSCCFCQSWGSWIIWWIGWPSGEFSFQPLCGFLIKWPETRQGRSIFLASKCACNEIIKLWSWHMHSAKFCKWRIRPKSGWEGVPLLNPKEQRGAPLALKLTWPTADRAAPSKIHFNNILYLLTTATMAPKRSNKRKS